MNMLKKDCKICSLKNPIYENTSFKIYKKKRKNLITFIGTIARHKKSVEIDVKVDALEKILELIQEYTKIVPEIKISSEYHWYISTSIGDETHEKKIKKPLWKGKKI